mmetsp:Transcript_4651/g.7495  ORF Transcript_4651/g.7495 Transcript_4651/m.7495 type:complete len:355 (+) Transcript_4651:78-1142(+)
MATDSNNFDGDSLEFQDFGHSSSTTRGSLGDLSAPIGSATFEDNPRGSSTNDSGSNYSCWHIRYYSKWFNVDTADVVGRVAFSTVPVSDKFFDKVDGNPDLYGPVWISSTVVFMLAATGNFASWIQFAASHGMQATGWVYDFTKMTAGATIIYAYTFLIPLILFLAMRYAGSRLGLIDLICLYGYSLFIYIPASILCVPPSSIVQWSATAVAAIASTVSVVRTLRYEATRDSVDKRLVTPIITAAGVLSLALAVVLKLFLFENADYGDLLNVSSVSVQMTTSPVIAVPATLLAPASEAPALDVSVLSSTLQADISATVLPPAPEIEQVPALANAAPESKKDKKKNKHKNKNKED